MDFKFEFTVNNTSLTILGLFPKNNSQKEKECTMHCFASWKHHAVETVVKNAMDEDAVAPYRQFHSKIVTNDRPGWMQCGNCSRYVCHQCI